MILPLIMRTTEEALKAVPDSFREGSFGLGAGKLRTVFKIVLPSAIPGILAGTHAWCGIGRIGGETAALIYTAGTVAQVPTNVLVPEEPWQFICIICPVKDCTWIRHMQQQSFF